MQLKYVMHSIYKFRWEDWVTFSKGKYTKDIIKSFIKSDHLSAIDNTEWVMVSNPYSPSNILQVVSLHIYDIDATPNSEKEIAAFIQNFYDNRIEGKIGDHFVITAYIDEDEISKKTLYESHNEEDEKNFEVLISNHLTNYKKSARKPFFKIVVTHTRERFYS
jgi:hypothetical protein